MEEKPLVFQSTWKTQSQFQPGSGLRQGRCQRAKWEWPYNWAESRGKVQRQKSG